MIFGKNRSTGYPTIAELFCLQFLKNSFPPLFDLILETGYNFNIFAK